VGLYNIAPLVGVYVMLCVVVILKSVLVSSAFFILSVNLIFCVNMRRPFPYLHVIFCFFPLNLLHTPGIPFIQNISIEEHLSEQLTGIEISTKCFPYSNKFFQQ
jgi:hypothetical protein